MSSGIFSSEHVAALCGVVLGALAYYMVGVRSKGGEFTWYEHGLMLAIILSGWVGCDW